ncbi:hypothetical protein AA313_de0206925 [Arthrobotrys entomopaga]|nr:hypothetical protein AA313_de0206925 [Arthrobotrys entomopaga]
MSKLSTKVMAKPFTEVTTMDGSVQSSQIEDSAFTSQGLTRVTLRCAPPFTVEAPTPPETPTTESLEQDILQIASIAPTDILTPPPSPQSEKEGSLSDETASGSNVSVSGETLADDEEQARERLRYERQKAIFLRNATALRKKHYAKAAAETATKIAKEKFAKYIELSYMWGRSVDFESWLVPMPETVKFEKRKVKPFQKSSNLAIPQPANGTSLYTLHDTLISRIMENLDFPSTQQLRLVAKKFDAVYSENREKICDTIAARTPQMSYIPAFLFSSESTKMTSEKRLRQNHFCTSWTVQTILSDYRKTAAKYQETVVETELANELYQANKVDCPQLQSPRSDVLKGATYPFPTLMEYLLEKHLGGPRRTRPNLPRLTKKLTLMERSTAMDSQESRKALKWVMQLIRWYVAQDMTVYYAINDSITCDDDEDVMLSPEEFDEFWRKLEPAQIWELVRLVGIKTEGILELVKERGFPRYEKNITEVDVEEIKDEFILFRVKEIINLK